MKEKIRRTNEENLLHHENRVKNYQLRLILNLEKIK